MDRRLYQKVITTLAVVLYSSVAFAQTSNQQWRDSLNTLNRLIAVSPYRTDLHLRKAAVNLELQQWDFAVDEYNLILKHNPDNPAALFYRAYAYTHLRRYDLARNDYNDILLRMPTHLEARLGLSYVLQLMGKKTEALEQLNNIVVQHPDSAVGYVARASLETEMLLLDAAAFDWEEAIRREPDNTDYRFSYIDVLIRMGRKSKARRLLDELRSRGATPYQLQEYYGRIR